MENKNIVDDFLMGGWIISAIGAAGMIARMFVQKTPYTIREFLKNVISAAILSSIAWYILHDAPVNDFIKAISYGVTGVVAPEIINGIIALGKKFEKNPQKFIKK